MVSEAIWSFQHAYYLATVAATTDIQDNCPVRSTMEAKIPCRGVYVGGAGDLDVTLAGGSRVLFSAVPVGVVLPIQVKTIHMTTTTATKLTFGW